MTEEVQRYADAAMFRSEPLQVDRDAEGNITPKVTLLWMTPDPLGACAAMNEMYVGHVVRDIARDVTDEQRQKVLDDMAKTTLTTPLENIELQFCIEGVTRSFTHQMVRQRTGAYAQESLRFAVKEDPWVEICARPPSVKSEQNIKIWMNALNDAQNAYERLISNGIPAEDARGLIPHSMTTRLIYKTDLRNLTAEAGKRLCTQAQFEWRTVMTQIAQAIRHATHQPDGPMAFDVNNRWQYEAIAESWIFRPICYHTGQCEFMGSADRFCSIRDKVEALHQIGVKPEHWDARLAAYGDAMRKGLPGIYPAEWLMDPAAAREGGSMH